VAFYKRVFTFELFVFCALPLFVNAFFYIMTARHLVKSAYLVSEGTQNPQMNKRKNVAKYVMRLTLVFLISYVPYHDFWIYIVFSSGREINLSFFHFRYRLFHLSHSDYILFTSNEFCSNSCNTVLYQFTVQKTSETLLMLLL